MLAPRDEKVGRSARAAVGEVRVLARGLAILRAFTPRNEWLSNQDIAAVTRLPKPTVSRLVAKLATLGYLVHSETLGKYRLGTSVLTLGFNALANLDVRVVVRPFLQKLADEEDALGVLANRDGMAMVCSDVCHSSKSIFTLRVNPGSRLVLPYSAMGRALLGAMPEKQRAAMLREVRSQFSKEWPRLHTTLAESLEEYQRCEFCLALGSLQTEINGIAVVIETPGAPPSYSLGLAAPSFKLPADYLRKRLGPKLVEIKRIIEARLRAMAPTGAGSA